jgi:hypothetical protein
MIRRRDYEAPPDAIIFLDGQAPFECVRLSGMRITVAEVAGPLRRLRRLEFVRRGKG